MSGLFSYHLGAVKDESTLMTGFVVDALGLGSPWLRGVVALDILTFSD